MARTGVKALLVVGVIVGLAAGFRSWHHHGHLHGGWHGYGHHGHHAEFERHVAEVCVEAVRKYDAKP